MHVQFCSTDTLTRTKIMNAYEEKVHFQKEIERNHKQIPRCQPEKRRQAKTLALIFLADIITTEFALTKQIYTCPVRNLLPVQVCIVMNLAVIQTPTVNQLDRSKLEQSGRLYIFIYIYICFISKDTKGNQEMTNM